MGEAQSAVGSCHSTGCQGSSTQGGYSVERLHAALPGPGTAQQTRRGAGASSQRRVQSAGLPATAPLPISQETMEKETVDVEA